MKNDYDADSSYNHRESMNGNGGLRWMSVLVMVLVVFGFFSLVWYAYNASVMNEESQEMVKVIAPEREVYKEKPEEAGGLDIAHKDIETYQLMRRNPTIEEETAKVERLLPAQDEPVLIQEKTPETSSDKDPFVGAELEKLAEIEANISSPVRPASENEAEPSKEVLLKATKTQDTPEQHTIQNEPVSNAQKAESAQEKTLQQDPIVQEKPAMQENVVAQPEPNTASPIQTAPKIEAAPKPQPAPKPAPKTVNPNVYLQLAAVRSTSEAATLWNKHNAKYPDLLKGYTYYTESVNVPGKGLFYRVRVRGFANRDEAARTCNSLKSRGLDCLISQ